MCQTGLSRAEVIDSLIQTRPEVAKYVKDLEEAQTPGPCDDVPLKDTTKELGLALDFLIAMAQCAPADTDTDPDPNPVPVPNTQLDPTQSPDSPDLHPPSNSYPPLSTPHP